MHRLQADLTNALMQESGQILLAQSLSGHMIAWGPTVPTDGTSGYAKSCVFFWTGASSASDRVWVNNGTGASSAFAVLASNSTTDFGSSGIQTDVVAESTTDAGVTVDGTLIKDGQLQGTAPIKANTISEYTAATGVTADGVLLKDGAVTTTAQSDFGSAGLKADAIAEHTGGSGVTVGGVLLKSSAVTATAQSDFGSAGIKADAIVEHTGSAGVTVASLLVKSGDLYPGDGNSIRIADNSGAAFRVYEGSNAYLTFVTTNGAELLVTGKRVRIQPVDTLAATGSDLAGSAPILFTSAFVQVTGANGTAGVNLPTCANGDVVYVYNDSASTLKVYGNSGSVSINGGSGGASVSVSAHKLAVFIAYDTTHWSGNFA